MNNSAQFDHYLSNTGPAAFVIREHLAPVEGLDAAIFPPSYAAGDGFPGGYNIDRFSDRENVCLIDSVGAQSNRIEPIFKEEAYKHLVPQIIVEAGSKKVNLLDAGHRAGDAIVRCSELEVTLNNAFKAVLGGDHEPLAKIGPTSLVFGVWDSRDTSAKLPRLVSSTIRAFNVKSLTRHAQYNPPVDYTEEKLLDEPGDLRDAEGKIKGKHPFAQRGFTHLPVSKAENVRGGVLAESIRRDATLSLTALKMIRTEGDEKKLALQRYIFGLALVAFTYQPTEYLRQGCLLVLNPEVPRTFDAVFANGERRPSPITHQQAVEYAGVAAEAFGVGRSITVPFDVKLAKKDLDRAKKGKKTE